MPMAEVPCQVVGCDATTRTARAFDFEGQQVWRMVCAEHRDRLEAGETPVLVDRPFDLADRGGNVPAVIMETD